MQNILKELTQASHYAKHGWETVDTAAKSRNCDRLKNYEQSLKDMVAAINHQSGNSTMLAERLNMQPGTAKKHLIVLYKRGLIDRERRKIGLLTTYFYFKKSNA